MPPARASRPRARLIESYVETVHQRDSERLAALLAPDAIFLSDGGGKTFAARRPVHGPERIARLDTGIARKLKGRYDLRLATVNGRTGLIGYLDDRPFAVTSFDTDGLRILSVMRVLNPDKLRCAFA